MLKKLYLSEFWNWTWLPSIWMQHMIFILPPKFVFGECVRFVIIPSAQWSCWVFYWFHSIHQSAGPSVHLSVRPSMHPSMHPSVHPASCVRSEAPTVLVGSISYLHISYCATSEGVLHAKFLEKCKNIGNFLNFVTLVLNWDLMWITSVGNHGVATGISERRCSSCSSLWLAIYYLLVLIHFCFCKQTKLHCTQSDEISDTRRTFSSYIISLDNYMGKGYL